MNTLFAMLLALLGPPDCPGDTFCECNGSQDCYRGHVCGDTRTCSITCDPNDRTACKSLGAECPPWLGYCAIPCEADRHCQEKQPGSTCASDGFCWYHFR
jgi:hypothetical protein